MKTIDETVQLLFSMYTENTGRHILDSGGVYGRNWERNKKLTIEQAMQLPDVTVEKYGDVKTTKDLVISVNVFKYLVNAGLELDDICKEFNKLQDTSDNWDFDGDIYGCSKEAGVYLEDLCAEIGTPFNTYNDSIQLLSQVLQGTYVEINEQKYIALQIHGGCDVRGGYTNAKLFKLPQFAEYLPIPNVYGNVGKISVDNMYDDYSLTDENGKHVKIGKNTKIELELMEASY